MARIYNAQIIFSCEEFFFHLRMIEGKGTLLFLSDTFTNIKPLVKNFDR